MLKVINAGIAGGRVKVTLELSKIMTEKEFQLHVEQMAKIGGWQFYHTWNSIHSAPGFPDNVMAKPPRLVFMELKTELGKVTAAQQRWLDILASIPGVEVYLFRPSEWEEIKKVLLG